jgi:hypothetical protein
MPRPPPAAVSAPETHHAMTDTATTTTIADLRQRLESLGRRL